MTQQQNFKARALHRLLQLQQGFLFGLRALDIIVGRFICYVRALMMLTWNATKYLAIYPLAIMAATAVLLTPTGPISHPDVQLISGLYSKYGFALRDVPTGQIRTFVCDSAPSDISAPQLACENPREELVPLATAIQSEADALRTFYLIAAVVSLTLGFGGQLLRQFGAFGYRAVNYANCAVSSKRID